MTTGFAASMTRAALPTLSFGAVRKRKTRPMIAHGGRTGGDELAASTRRGPLVLVLIRAVDSMARATAAPGALHFSAVLQPQTRLRTVRRPGHYVSAVLRDRFQVRLSTSRRTGLHFRNRLVPLFMPACPRRHGACRILFDADYQPPFFSSPPPPPPHPLPTSSPHHHVPPSRACPPAFIAFLVRSPTEDRAVGQGRWGR